MYKLVISDDEGKNTVVPLVRDEITIGRKEGNTIRLTERNISRRHARLVKANGRFVIEDLHSYNGVRINGQRIGAETSLAAGDQIQIGDYQLALQVDGAETATVPEALSPMVADADTAMIAAPGPPARLVMITPPAPGAEFALTGERCRIGRAEDLDVWVNHRSISREHAEIQKAADGGLRLIDLGSANGVRVNGKDVQNALLEAGDVVELGQVRFRFVAAGEHYAFDADRTVQMDAVMVERPSSSKVPIFAALAIIGFAVVVAGGIAVWGAAGDDDETGDIEARPLVPDPAPTAAAAQGYERALAACEAAMAQLDITAALAQADAALTERPGDAAATACRARATALQPDARVFQAGLGHLAQGDYQAAYFDFENLAEDSPFRSRPQVVQAVQGYATQQNNAASTVLAGSPSEALRLAEFVLNMQGITPSQRATASAIKRAAEAGGGQHGQTEPVAVNEPRTPRGDRDRPRTPRRPAETGRADPTPTPPDPTPPRNEGSNIDAEARQCTMSGDNACVIRLLEGRARTAPQLGMLIEAYRARGQTQNALRHMRTYVSRFGSTPQARNYQQILARHGGSD